MSLTKKEKAEIVEAVLEAMAARNTGKQEVHDEDFLEAQAARWNASPIKSELAGIEIAPEDLYVMKDGEKKKYFTAEDADWAVANLPDGWRLPTRHEIALMIEEFGNNPETGKTDNKEMLEKLNLVPGGWQDFDGNSINWPEDGFWWSATAYSIYDRWSLYYDSSNSQFVSDNSNRSSGYYVRCVRTS